MTTRDHAPQDQQECIASTANAEPGMVDARNEALRKIGRNVVLFQQLEGVLKSLAAAQHPSMPISKAKTTHAKRLASIHVESLGEI